MSVTFFAPDAPCKQVDVDYGDGELVVEEVSTLPEVSLSQSTAATLLRALGLPSDESEMYGDAAGPELDALIKTTMKLVNSNDLAGQSQAPSTRLGAIRVGTTREGLPCIERGATLVDFGCSHERLTRRAAELLRLFTAARAAGYSVRWA